MAEVQGCVVEPFSRGIYSINVLTGLWIKHVHWLFLAAFTRQKGTNLSNSTGVEYFTVSQHIDVEKSHWDFLVFTPISTHYFRAALLRPGEAARPQVGIDRSQESPTASETMQGFLSFFCLCDLRRLCIFRVYVLPLTLAGFGLMPGVCCKKNGKLNQWEGLKWKDIPRTKITLEARIRSRINNGYTAVGWRS